MLVVNTKTAGVARDVRVRQAIQHGIDGQEIIDKVYGGRGGRWTACSRRGTRRLSPPTISRA